jgi:uncharacterized sulfatase
MTGKHTGHTAIRGNTGHVLPKEAVTITSLLKKAGYATGGVGKWALGHVGSSGHPNKQGFDFWYGYLDQGDAHNYYPEVLYRNETAEPQPGNEPSEHKRVSRKKTTYSHDQMTNEALDFVRRHAEKPFFLKLAYTIPHTNNEAGRHEKDGMEVPDYGAYADRPWPKPEKGFAAMVARLDRDVGRLIDLLKEQGIEKRTLVMFTSDNGPHAEGGHKHEFFNSNGPLRGFKRDLYDGGIRVPMIAWWPGTVQPGQTTGHISAFWDVLPTLCDLAGIESPTGIDGISFAPLLRGQPQPKHEYLFWQFGQAQSKKIKTAIRKDHWKAVRLRADAPIELYDLRTDPGESKNIAADHPDVTARMKTIFREAVQ